MRKDRMWQTREYSLADAVVRTVFLSTVALLGFFSAVFMAQDVFPGWVLAEKARLWLYGIVIFTAALHEIGIRALPYRLQILCRLSAAAGYACVGYRYWKEHRIDLEDGACALATEYLVKFNSHLKTSIFIWKGKTEFLSMAFSFWALAAVAALLLLALLWHRRGLLLLLPIAVFAAQLTIGYVPEWKGMAYFFAALLFVHADGGMRQKTLRMHVDRQQRRRRTWYLSYAAMGCLTGMTLLMLSGSRMLSNATQNKLLAAAPKVQEFQKKAEKHISNVWLSYFMPKQERISNQTPHYTGKEMLRVTATKCPAEDMLLKGFCGTDYENGSWYCDKQKFLEACADAGYDAEMAARELIQTPYDRYQQGADRIMMRYTADAQFLLMNVSENTQTDYTVEHTGDSSRYLYGPYAADYSQNQGKLVSDVTAHKRWRQDTCYFSGWDHFTGGIDISADDISDQKKQVFQWYDEFVKEAYLNTSDRVPSLEDYLPAMGNLRESYTYSLSAWDDWYSYENRNRFLLRSLQYEADTAEDASLRNIKRLQMALVVSDTLKWKQSYSLDLDPLPEGEDAVYYFLMLSQKGYCVHFASAAVFLLRELGVPARYASGYVVRKSDFKKKGEVFTASVKDSNAHAWVEIYLEQIGWIPIDVTPGTAAAQNTDTQSAQNKEQADAKDQETQTDTDDTQTDTDLDQTQTDTDLDQTQKDADQEKGKKSGQARFGYRLISAATVLLALILLLVSFRRIMRFYYEMPLREIREGKCRTAVRRINRRIYTRLLIYRKIPRQYLTDTAYEKILKSKYQLSDRKENVDMNTDMNTDMNLTADMNTDVNLTADMDKNTAVWTQFMQITRTAAFAQDEVTREDALYCWRIYCRTRKNKSLKNKSLKNKS